MHVACVCNFLLQSIGIVSIFSSVHSFNTVDYDHIAQLPHFVQQSLLRPNVTELLGHLHTQI